MREFTLEDNNGHRFRIGQPSRNFTLPDREPLPVCASRIVRQLPPSITP
jgi:hypothetical protein